MNRRSAGLGLTFAGLLAGCSGLSAPPAQRYFVLETTPTRLAPGALQRDAMLLVAPTTAASFYDSQEIIYSRRPGERAYYQLSSWTEPPNRGLATLLAARLVIGGAFRGAVETGSGVRGSLMLRTHLVELYHDAVAAPGTARATLSAELSDPTGRSLLAQHSFSTSAPVATYDAAGAVQGAGQALGQVLDEIAAWAAQAAATGAR
jgi:cholesterol transport system auxiliary component